MLSIHMFMVAPTLIQQLRDATMRKVTSEASLTITNCSTMHTIFPFPLVLVNIGLNNVNPGGLACWWDIATRIDRGTRGVNSNLRYPCKP